MASRPAVRNYHLVVLALGMAGVISLQPPMWTVWVLFGLVAVFVLAGQGIERWLPFERAPLGFALHAFGDALYLCSLAVWIGLRTATPSPAGTVFTLLVLLLATGATVVNLNLQLGRLGDVRHGWRFSLDKVDAGGIVLRTPRGNRSIPWKMVRVVERVDQRQAVILVDDPIPRELLDADIPWEEASPSGKALILHEQELGKPVSAFLTGIDAERSAETPSGS